MLASHPAAQILGVKLVEAVAREARACVQARGQQNVLRQLWYAVLRGLVEPFRAAQLQFFGESIGALGGSGAADQRDECGGVLTEQQVGRAFELDELVAPLEHVQQGGSEFAGEET